MTALSRRDLLGLAAFAAPAARVLASPFAPDPTFSSAVKVVNVFATVQGKHAEIIRDLTREDFVLEEDGRPQEIRYFSHESDLPLTIGLLVDTSGSQRRVLEEERLASSRFLDQVMREGKDKGFVIHFDSEVELLQDVTGSASQLHAALDELQVPRMQRPQWGQRPPGGRRRRGGTSLYDAVLLASDDVLKAQAGRKACVLLTDGVDNGSMVPLSRAIEAAQRADSLVYSVLFADPDAYRMNRPMMNRRGRPRRMPPQQHPDGKKVLKQLSDETGGAFMEVKKNHLLERIYAEIEAELRSQYSLGFSPAATGSAGYRTLRLTTKKKHLVVRARAGYYAG